MSPLQSYILSTTTETLTVGYYCGQSLASIVHPFNNNWNRFSAGNIWNSLSFNRTSFQQQLKLNAGYLNSNPLGFNRTSFQQQLKLGIVSARNVFPGFNRTSFQQQLKRRIWSYSRSPRSFNRTSFQQQLKLVRVRHEYATSASIVHPFNNNWN